MDKMYSVYDRKTKCYQPPFPAPTPEAATRSFHTVVNSPEHPVGKYPEDYTLMCVGSWLDQKGLIEGLPQPELVATGIDLYQPPKLHEQQIPMPLANGEESEAAQG